jgi:hypothetical protein
MVGLSAISVVLGAAIACAAGRYPRHRGAMETVAGTLLVVGLGLLGYTLQSVIGRP